MYYVLVFDGERQVAVSRVADIAALRIELIARGVPIYPVFGAFATCEHLACGVYGKGVEVIHA